MSRRGMPWSDGEVSELRQMLSAGLSAKDAAAKLNRSEEAIRTCAGKHGFRLSRSAAAARRSRG